MPTVHIKLPGMAVCDCLTHPKFPVLSYLIKKISSVPIKSEGPKRTESLNQPDANTFPLLSHDIAVEVILLFTPPTNFSSCAHSSIPFVLYFATYDSISPSAFVHVIEPNEMV